MSAQVAMERVYNFSPGPGVLPVPVLSASKRKCCACLGLVARFWSSRIAAMSSLVFRMRRKRGCVGC